MSILIDHVSRRFETFAAVNDLSLEVAEGELLALLGPSGSGKTTLLRLIAGLDFPDAGRILIGGRDATHLSAGERRIGFVFQHYALFRHMTVRQNIDFGMRVMPAARRPAMAERRARVERLLATVQLDGLGDRFPAQLSGGQRQRVALARALAIEPCVLLLDEPFGALDAAVRRDLRRWLRQLHDELPVTTIFVTHDQEEALEVADRIVVMNAGRIEQSGTPVEVEAAPATAFMYGFLGGASRFDVTVAAGRVSLAGRPLPPEAVELTAGVADGPATGFVRAHEFRLLPAGDPASLLDARVSHVVTHGGTARVELALGAGRTIEAELPRAAWESLALAPGAPVGLRPERVAVFPPG
ncbi:TOBE-like domain-containing protein [Amaricoccus sp.]|uniref:sulfate/molybdate ABC transporter ATP-binding protein n=1 Tax=Amaricoccus sp. TaxID=1872485 RepID=UPI00261CD2D8|nr:TOBE-like domain-containing protein [Amaricoccus sp.]HRO11143.1 TOBE-like domain-containing protein [Amaricoccus sp.]